MLNTFFNKILNKMVTGINITTAENTAITAIDNLTYLTKQGALFYAENVFSIDNGATIDIAMDARGITSTLKGVSPSWATTAGSVLISFGTASEVTAGTVITPINRNAYSSRVAEMVLYFDATVTNAVMPPYPTYLVGAASTNQNSGGATALSTIPAIFSTEFLYVFRIQNNSGQAISLASNILWAEVLNPVM